LIPSEHKFTRVEKASIDGKVGALNDRHRRYFDTLCRSVYTSYDDDMTEIMGCCVDLMSESAA
jgi:hypothetical protein